MGKNRVGQVDGGDTAPRVDRLAYDVASAALAGGPKRAALYKALNPDPAKRDGLPFLPSFCVGRSRRIWAADFREWMEKLRAATLTVDLASDNTAPVEPEPESGARADHAEPAVSPSTRNRPPGTRRNAGARPTKQEMSR